MLKALRSGLVLIALGWIAYGLLGHRAIEAMFHSPSSWVADRVMPGRATGSLQDYAQAADRMMLLAMFWVPVWLLTLVLLARRPLTVLLVAGGAVLLSFAAFCACEWFPSLPGRIGLDAAVYFRDSKYYRRDDKLAFKERPLLHIFTRSRDAAPYGLELPPATTDWATDEEGFRNNIGSPPLSDVVVLGDSTISYGYDFDDSFTRRLQNHLPGLTVHSLGTSGYGPYQYVEVLKTYGLKRRPKFAIFSFNEGNDLEDIDEYLAWKQGVAKHFRAEYQIAVPGILARYGYAFASVAGFMRQQSWDAASRLFATDTLEHDGNATSPDLAWIHLAGGGEHPILFVEKQRTQTPEQIAAADNWQRLRGTLLDFKAICAANGIAPVVMFIPTKTHIYAEYSTAASGVHWLAIRDEQIKAKTSVESAFERLNSGLGLSVLSLSPAFETAAKQGRVLHYPLSVHWNSEGNELAASEVASVLRANPGLQALSAAGEPAKILNKN